MSKFIRGLGSLIAIVGGVLGFVASLYIVFELAGIGGVLVGLFVFPLTFALVPFYTLFVFGTWNMLLLNYGSMVAGWILHGIADNLEKSETPRKPVSTRIQEPAPSPTLEPTQDNSARTLGLWVVGIFVVVAVLMALFSSSPSSPAHTPTRTRTARPTKEQVSIQPTRTPRPVSLQACVTDSTIRIRQGPGTEYEAIGGMVSGTCMSILGRNADSSWVYMVAEDNKAGWVNASLLTIDGDLSRVSVQGDSDVLSLAPATKLVPTQKLPSTATRKPVISFTNTPRPTVIQPTAQNNNCSLAYPGVCIPPRPPDLDCKDVPYRRFTVLSPDPHNFDSDRDGIGCES